METRLSRVCTLQPRGPLKIWNRKRQTARTPAGRNESPGKGPENGCRVKVVDKCRKHFTLLTIFLVFCPAQELLKHVKLCLDTL